MNPLFSSSRNQWNGTTGFEFEREFVREFTTSWDGSYIPYRQAMDLVRRNQPRDAVAVEGQNLLNAIARELGVNVNDLKMFTSAGGNNALDCFHKIDAFIDLRKDGAMITVPLDFKMRNIDTRRTFAIRPSDVEEGFANVARDIAHFFRSSLRMASDRAARNVAA